jgi:hypothetical protein
MMIKVNNEFLDFNDLIEVEKQIKLFEEIATTDGDFSYAFDLQKTINNTRILQNPFPDNISKPVYQKIPAKLLNDSGAEIYNGYLRIERITNVYSCSFFAGNNNWFGLLSGKLSELNFSQYDTDQTQSAIQAAIFNTEGVVFPLLDNGALDTRRFPLIKVEDFVAGIYVKTVFNKIFSSHGIKIQGELLNDVKYLSAITVSNGKSQEEIDANSTFAENTGLSRPGENVEYPVIFSNDSVFPYFDGSSNNYNPATGVYTCPVKMRLRIVVKLKPAIVDDSYNNRIYLYLNGVFTFVDIGLAAGGLYNSATPGDQDPFVFDRTIVFEAGDTISFTAEWQQSTGSTANDILSGTLEITPEFIYKAYGNYIVPDWTQQQYVSNVFRLFNVLASYHQASQTLTLNLFEKIKSKTPIDLSEYISETEVDYTDFISSYGKKSLLSYKELEQEDFRHTRFAYEKGEIDVDNDFLNDSEDILESDFSNPIGYLNQVFDMSIEKTNLLGIETDTSTEATAVTDSFGQARFAIPEDIFLIGDLVRIEESTNPDYNGDWMIETIGAGFVEMSGLLFDTTATAKLTKIIVKYTESGDVFIMHHIPLYSVSNFSGLATIRLENTDLATMAVAFFNLLFQGRPINYDFINSMSFSGSGELHYQQTLIDQYFRLFSHTLNDPVKLLSTAHFPYALFERIDFLRPITIRTIETTNMYYLNRITGYKESYYPCTLELIKLSGGGQSIDISESVPPTPVYSPPLYITGVANNELGSEVVLQFGVDTLQAGDHLYGFTLLVRNSGSGFGTGVCSEISGNTNVININTSGGGSTPRMLICSFDCIAVNDLNGSGAQFQFGWSGATIDADTETYTWIGLFRDASDTIGDNDIAVGDASLLTTKVSPVNQLVPSAIDEYFLSVIGISGVVPSGQSVDNGFTIFAPQIGTLGALFVSMAQPSGLAVGADTQTTFSWTGSGRVSAIGQSVPGSTE